MCKPASMLSPIMLSCTYISDPPLTGQRRSRASNCRHMGFCPGAHPGGQCLTSMCGAAGSHASRAPCSKTRAAAAAGMGAGAGAGAHMSQWAGRGLVYIDGQRHIGTSHQQRCHPHHK